MQRILITPGEPSGIGPELCLQLLTNAKTQTELAQHELILVADRQLLQDRAQQLNLAVELIDFNPNQKPCAHQMGQIKVWHHALPVNSIAGKLDANNAPYVLNTLNTAIDACLSGQAQALVTAPVHKGVINETGYRFSGHTEYLQARCHSPQTVMLLAGQSMRVALATTHLPLKEVANAITRPKLTQIINLLHNELKHKLGLDNPCIYVCGLNPHAGENGYLGTEEIDTIIPVMTDLRQQGYRLVGPLPADTLFNEDNLKEADCVLAMYHDQGLPVLKYASFGSAVNITLGLPIIRTSVDHGTALNLAGTGKASYTSLLAAVHQALAMCQHIKPNTIDTECLIG